VQIFDSDEIKSKWFKKKKIIDESKKVVRFEQYETKPIRKNIK